MAVQTIQEGKLTIYNITKYSTIVVKIPEITSYIYQHKLEQTIAEMATDSAFSLLVNSSFFDYDFPSRSFSHAGYLKIHDQVLAPMIHDNQITRLFAYDSKNKAVSYFDTLDLDKTSDFDLVVQTGPQIVEKNTICTVFIDASTNGNRAAFRTAFGSVNGREFYIIVACRQFTLEDLGSMLLRSGIFSAYLMSSISTAVPQPRYTYGTIRRCALIHHRHYRCFLASGSKVCTGKNTTSGKTEYTKQDCGWNMCCGTSATQFARS